MYCTGWVKCVHALHRPQPLYLAPRRTGRGSGVGFDVHGTRKLLGRFKGCGRGGSMRWVNMSFYTVSTYHYSE